MNPSADPLKKRVAERLCGLRDKKNLTLPEMAKASGVGARSISDYEAGIRLPGGTNLAKLSNFFKMSPAALLK